MGTQERQRNSFILLFVILALSAATTARAAPTDPWRTWYFDPPTTWGPVVYGVVMPWEDVTHDGTPDFVEWGISDDAGHYHFHVGIYDGATRALLRIVNPPGSNSVFPNDADRPDRADVDGDGTADLLLRWYSATSPTIHLSTYSPARDELVHTWDFPDPTGFYPQSSHLIDDVTSDTVPELLVANGDYSPEGQPSHSGEAAVYSGRDGHLIRRLYSPSPTQNGNFGECMCTLDDLNHDGIRDFVIAESAAPDSASASTDVFHIYSGATLDLLRTLPGPGSIPTVPGATVYLSLCRGIRDLNSDGVPEIVVGYSASVPMIDTVFGSSDLNYVLSGADGTALHKIGVLGESFAWLFSDLFDFNRDGVPDFLLNPVPPVPPGSWTSYAPAVAVGDVPPAQLFIFDSGNTGVFDFWTTTIPDATGDGRPDVFVSALDAYQTGWYRTEIWTLLPQGVAVTPEVDFGIRDPDDGPVPREATVGNDNYAPLAVRSVHIDGADAASFHLINPDLPTIYGPIYTSYGFKGSSHHGVYNYSLEFDPASVGEKRADLVFETNDPTTPVIQIPLYGQAVEITPAERAVYLTAQEGEQVLEIDPKGGDRRQVSSPRVGLGSLTGELEGINILSDSTLLVTMGDSLVDHLATVDTQTGDRKVMPLSTVILHRSDREHNSHYRNLARDGQGRFLIANDQWRESAPRILRIDSLSSRTAVVVSSAYENVGKGPAFDIPWDVDVTHDGTILVTDTELGLFRVDPVTGDRELLRLRTSNGDEITSLPLQTAIGLDGTIYAFFAGGRAVYSVDLATTAVLVVCGKGKGTGPEFSRLGALAVDPLDGAIYVYDEGLATLFRVDRRTGDRVVVSCSRAGAEVGGGAALPQSAYFMAVSTRQHFGVKGLYLH